MSMNTFASPARRHVSDVMADAAVRDTAGQAVAEDDDAPFRSGDVVVYPAHGVGVIESIGTEMVAGHALELIRVSFIANRMTLRVPRSKARLAGLRPVASPARLAEALAILVGRARAGSKLWARRAIELQARINSGDLIELAKVVRDLRHHAMSDDGSFSERQLYAAALERIAGEMSAITGVVEADVVADLLVRLRSTPLAAAIPHVPIEGEDGRKPRSSGVPSA